MPTFEFLSSDKYIALEKSYRSTLAELKYQAINKHILVTISKCLNYSSTYTSTIICNAEPIICNAEQTANINNYLGPLQAYQQCHHP